MFPLEDVTGCLRILPHLNDTGGFFVAVFEKTQVIEEGGERESEGGREEEGG